MARHAQAMREFLFDSGCAGLILRTPPDLEFVAGKFLTGFLLGEEEPTLGAFAFGGTFTTPEAFYREAEVELAKNVAQLAAGFREEGEPLALPSGVLWERRSESATPELLFAEYLEKITRAMMAVFDLCLFVVRFESVENAAAAGASIASLGGAIALPNLRLILMDDTHHRRFPELRSFGKRYAVRPYRPLEVDAFRMFRDLVTHPDERVLGLTSDAKGAAKLKALFRKPELQETGGRLYAIEGAFRSRYQFSDLVYRMICHQRKGFPEGLPQDIYDLRGMEYPEATLTELLGQAVTHWHQPDRAICFLISPENVEDEAEWLSFANRLIDSAAETRVKYILFGSNGLTVPTERPVERPWRLHEFTLPAEDIQAGLEDSLNDPNLDPNVRISHLTMLGVMHVNRGNPALGLPLLQRAVLESEGSGNTHLQKAAWTGMATGFERSGDFEMSGKAHAAASSIAPEEDDNANTARSLMGIGNSQFMTGKYLEAIKSYGLARQYWAIEGQFTGECQATIWAAEAHRRLKQFEDAETLFNEALEYYKGLKAPFEDVAAHGLAEVYERLAALYDEQKRNADATACRTRAKDNGSEGHVAPSPV